MLHLEDAHLTLDFALPETLLLRDIASIELHSVVDYAGMLPVDAVEERMAVNQDRFRTWTQDWYGRLFLFQWHGPQNPAFTWGVVLAVGGWLGCCGALSGLASRRRPLPQLASPASDISRGESV